MFGRRRASVQRFVKAEHDRRRVTGVTATVLWTLTRSVTRTSDIRRWTSCLLFSHSWLWHSHAYSLSVYQYALLHHRATDIAMFHRCACEMSVSTLFRSNYTDNLTLRLPPSYRSSERLIVSSINYRCQCVAQDIDRIPPQRRRLGCRMTASTLYKLFQWLAAVSGGSSACVVSGQGSFCNETRICPRWSDPIRSLDSRSVGAAVELLPWRDGLYPERSAANRGASRRLFKPHGTAHSIVWRPMDNPAYVCIVSRQLNVAQ